MTKYVPSPVDQVLMMYGHRRDDCWIWPFSLDSHGYGQVRWGGRTRKAYAVIHELLRGPLPIGYEHDHTCRRRACVNPGHMEAVTRRENILRGESIAARSARRESCDLCGGVLTPFRRDREGPVVGRQCKPCKNRKARAWRLATGRTKEHRHPKD